MKRAIILTALFALSGTAANVAVVHANTISRKVHSAVPRTHIVHKHYVRAVRGHRHEAYMPLVGSIFGIAPRRGYESSTPAGSAPSYESPSVDGSSNWSEDAAAAIQSSNDEAALNAATAAAEQQNEAAQAAAQQTENNANSQ